MALASGVGPIVQRRRYQKIWELLCPKGRGATADFAPTHPGAILAEEFLGPLGITPYRLAKEIRVSQTRVGEILAGKRRISADTGLRLSRALGLSDMFWINLQARYDADRVRLEKGDELAHINRLVASGS
ncbi:HigA family addiction module antitoxin [Mycobacterium sp. Aquia_216]|uniref:HigA family addiction module antitoxin n=1 Tax=Mycobacterium sp. Aquia_216 TaxID=2991729 RepID=UPI00227AC931|nr:HigA family addiction module antitoxin [Mycobacterium sp. Aquia_216]WAJ46204.1 HigA family addiction module antitoxin [Mycobacterium sp. Aquia_216]